MERNTLDDAPAAAAAEVREPDWYAAATVLSDDPVPPPGSVSRPAFQPLHRAARFNPFLRCQLGALQPGSVPDLRRLLRATERGEVPRHLPLLARRTWAPTAHLLLDLSDATQPYHGDFRALVAALQAQRGAPGLRVSVLVDGPDRHPWVREGRRQYRRFTPPDGQIPLLILSDLGAGGQGGRASGVRIGWEAFGRQLRAAGCQPFVLSPLPPQALAPVLRQLFRVFHWDRRAALKAPVKPAASPDAHDPAQRAAHAETVLALGASAIFLEPTLIRALRLLVPGADSATDSAVWWHANVCHGSGAAVAYGSLDLRTHYQERFRTLPPRLQRQAIDTVRAHHAHLAQSIRMIESETAARLMDGQDAVAAGWHADAARTLLEADTPGWAAWRARHLNRQSLALWAGNRPLAALWASAHAEALRAGESVPRPEALDETDLAFFLGIRPAPRIRQAVLRQIGQTLVLDEAATGPGAVLAAFRLDTDLVRIDRTISDGETTTTLVPIARLPQPLAQLSPDLERIGLQGLTQRVRFGAVARPPWARAVGRDADGLWCEVEWLGQRVRLRWGPLESAPHWGWQPKGGVGVDTFGLYADFTVAGVTQRCRWIAPGSFRMGSPPGEVGRDDDETQHDVTLTRGYWLADSACTQALWQAVMGANPSYFKGDPARPVEKVSWNDVHTFLDRLNARVPGLDAGLPSEAQW
ncbi:MAG TPA: SUMF1/EgtB/PvdO family nonheme iron enzyme, partial [Burkholderiaceae bacterium]|nr:SUMF1/EgtB/PvdO family nonheme iron enzyme [Burkholderiaceae bacterium]